MHKITSTPALTRSVFTGKVNVSQSVLGTTLAGTDELELFLRCMAERDNERAAVSADTPA
jgi:hypothetical protein